MLSLVREGRPGSLVQSVGLFSHRLGLHEASNVPPCGLPIEVHDVLRLSLRSQTTFHLGSLQLKKENITRLGSRRMFMRYGEAHEHSIRPFREQSMVTPKTFTVTKMLLSMCILRTKTRTAQKLCRRFHGTVLLAFQGERKRQSPCMWQFV